MSLKKKPITAYTRRELTELFREHYKGGSLAADYFFSEIFQNRSFSPKDFPMFNFPARTLEQLENQLYLPDFKITCKHEDEDVVKFLWKSEDNYLSEAVFLKMKSHGTLCLSSQIGCSFGCTFCETGQHTFVRSLKTHEIIGQYLGAAFHLGLKARHLVFMGMGEPLVNLKALISSLKIFLDPKGPGILPRDISISTCGYVPGIEKFTELCALPGNEEFERLHLAVSLHAGNNQLRDSLVPVNRQYPLEDLKRALLHFNASGKKDRLYLEYVLLPGINDSEKDARETADFARELKTTINLIGYNPGTKALTRSPSLKEMGCFFDRLWSHGQACRMRDSKGRSIMAGCGQLVYK